MIQPIRTLVVDDDHTARAALVALLRGDPEILVVGECGTGVEAVATIERLTPDLLLLDVGSEAPDTLGLLRALGDGTRPEIVFVTTHAEFALHAFEAHALDYLLKPFSEERLADAMRQAKARVCQRRIGELGRQIAALLRGGDADTGAPALLDGLRSDALASARGRDATGARLVRPPRRAPVPFVPPVPPPLVRSPYLDRIVVRHGRDTLFVSTEELDWIGAADYYVKLHTAGRAYLVRDTMQHMEARLDPHRFARIHRSAIVNVDRVKRIQSANGSGRHLVLLRDGTQLQMSRGRKEMLEQALGQTI